jgi:hypothetical protein
MPLGGEPSGKRGLQCKGGVIGGDGDAQSGRAPKE